MDYVLIEAHFAQAAIPQQSHRTWSMPKASPPAEIPLRTVRSVSECASQSCSTAWACGPTKRCKWTVAKACPTKCPAPANDTSVVNAHCETGCIFVRRSDPQFHRRGTACIAKSRLAPHRSGHDTQENPADGPRHHSGKSGRQLRSTEGLIEEDHDITLAAAADSASFMKNFRGRVHTLPPPARHAS